MKTLFFEGAGCVPRGDVENCRIRTAFYNKEGREIYLELSGIESNKYTAKSLANFTNIGFVDYCHYITEDLDDCNKSCVREVPTGLLVERKHFEYSKDGILKFVNDILFCDFDNIKICDVFDGYQVHQSEYNRFGGRIRTFKTGFDRYYCSEDFATLYYPDLAKARRNAFKKYDELYRTKLNGKYGVLGVKELDNKTMILSSWAREDLLRKAELPRNFTLMFRKDENGNIKYTPQRNGRLSDAFI